MPNMYLKNNNSEHDEQNVYSENELNFTNGAKSFSITLKSDGRHAPNKTLGIHVIAALDETEQKGMGLVIQKIEPSGRVFVDGRLKVGDLIIQINKKSLIGLDFGHAQEILKEAIQRTNSDYYADLEFRVVRKVSSDQYESNDDESYIINEKESNAQTITNGCNINNTDEPVSPQNTYQNHIQQYSNNVKGKRMTIQLIKGPQGLGFTLACRDNYLNDDCSPIYIKNILPNGAAIADGRLQRGDRLLEINKMDMTQKTLIEVVNILRKTKLGTFVELVVSRQIMNYNNNTSLSATTNKEFNDISAAQLPRELPQKLEDNEFENNKNETSSPMPDEENELESKSKRKLLIFDIPLNDTGSAGLGVSVKGKTKRIEGSDRLIDLGIFVKTVIHGGAASKDGRLKANDQLINLNGISLLGKENEEAMFLLREAMQFESKPGHVQLTVSRKVKNKDKQSNQIDLSQKNLSDEVTDSNFKLVKNSMSNSKNSIVSTDENEPSSFAFNRDAPSRRSMSSKRSFMGAHNGMAQSLTSSNICKSNENQSTNSYNHKRSQTIDNFSLRLIKNYQNSENKNQILLNENNKNIKENNQNAVKIYSQFISRQATSFNEKIAARKSLSMENVADSNAETQPNNITKFETVSARSAKQIARPTILNKPVNNELADVQNYSWNNNRFRSINRSFRKAVDKSFEVNNAQVNSEETSDSNINSNENKNIQKVDKKLYPITHKKSILEHFHNMFKSSSKKQKIFEEQQLTHEQLAKSLKKNKLINVKLFNGSKTVTLEDTINQVNANPLNHNNNLRSSMIKSTRDSFQL